MSPLGSRSGSCWPSHGPCIAQENRSVSRSSVPIAFSSRIESMTCWSDASGSSQCADPGGSRSTLLLWKKSPLAYQATLLVMRPKGDFDERVQQRDLAQLLAVGRQHHEEIVDPRRRQMLPLLDDPHVDLVGEGVDRAVRGDVEIVMRLLEIFPDQIGILVHLDHAVAPRRVADALVDHQKVAVRVEVGLTVVDELVRLRPGDRRALVPDLAVRQVPLVQGLARG